LRRGDEGVEACSLESVFLFIAILQIRLVKATIPPFFETGHHVVEPASKPPSLEESRYRRSERTAYKRKIPIEAIEERRDCNHCEQCLKA
jgi:hypothetical protein